jgi:aryl-alcohol dehydrogenase-like predicted oxidoreductase
MKTYQIPGTDLIVSRMASGTASIGGNWNQIPPSETIKAHAVQLIHTAVDHGINHLDMADIYGKGKATEVVGHVLSQSPGLRDELVLQGKCGVVLADTPTAGDPVRYDFSYDHLVSAVEDMLSKLGTDHIDLLVLSEIFQNT